MFVSKTQTTHPRAW